MTNTPSCLTSFYCRQVYKVLTHQENITIYLKYIQRRESIVYANNAF